MTRRYSFLLMALVLSACGGGGGNSGTCVNASACTSNFDPYGNGGSGSTPTPTPTPTPTSGIDGMTFSPNPVTLTVPQNQTGNFSITATPQTPSEFSGATTLYAFIVDKTGVILPLVTVTPDGGNSYTANLLTSSSLAQGTYSGSFTLELCADKNCTQPFPGSPWTEPYVITVTAPGPT